MSKRCPYLESNSIAPGAMLEIYLPTQPDVGMAPRPKLRRVRVELVRDLAADPFTLTEFLETPWMRFGRFLLVGKDARTKRGIWTALDWQMPRTLAIFHSDGEPAKINSGRGRFERTCFIEMCEQLRGAGEFLIGLRDFPPVVNQWRGETIEAGQAKVCAKAKRK